MTHKPIFYQDPDKIADAIIASVGKNIVLGLPLGLGKANHIVNALVQKATVDASISLKIFTALTLEKPQAKSLLEQRFLLPAMEKLFGNYPDLDYAKALRNGTLPKNIEVNEFFLLAGQWLNVARVQQSYIATNYSDAITFLLERGVNVVTQLVAMRGNEYSMSCNSDITVELMQARAEGRANFMLALQTNSELPFMGGDAVIAESDVAAVLQSDVCDFNLYAVPKGAVTLADQAIGLHVARLVRDGGTLQIGIGSIGDAVTKGLILRHADNAVFKDLVAKLSHTKTSKLYNDNPFVLGLYGLSEMFVEGFLHLAQQGILKRAVNGAIFHGAFFLDSHYFYKALRDMTDEARARFQMKSVGFTNTIYGDEMKKRAARVKASFINSTMMVNLRGAAISDALETGAIVSGVGGQHDFVSQSFALKDARSIIVLRSTRQSKTGIASNIVWTYGHETIPWHLRDIIVTEYGIADLRGQPDAEVIARLLAITDSRFQPALLAQAKLARKIDADYKILAEYLNNTREHIEECLRPARQKGILPKFPFGSDFTATEQRLMSALEILKIKSASKKDMAGLLVKGIMAKPPITAHQEALARMGFDKAKTAKDYFYQKILHAALLETDHQSEG